MFRSHIFVDIYDEKPLNLVKGNERRRSNPFSRKLPFRPTTFYGTSEALHFFKVDANGIRRICDYKKAFVLSDSTNKPGAKE